MVGGLEFELELRPSESLTQQGRDVPGLLSMDTSDEMPQFTGSERPAVPKGADELVAFYEKQLAAASLVQHRLQKQYSQLAEEKASLEASLRVQKAAGQQQIAVVHERAEHALAEAERSRQQVEAAGAAVQSIVTAVTRLAEDLDDSGATQELSSFHHVAHSTEGALKAIKAACAGSELLLELQLGVKTACLGSPLLTSNSAMASGLPAVADALNELQADAERLQRELRATKSREQELDRELGAAQLLFTGLEAEVVSLQQDQAQAAAKLQMSQEELLGARAQLVTAKHILAEADSPAADAVGQGLLRLDAHMVSIREFLEGLAMPPPVMDTLSSGSLQDQRITAPKANSARVAADRAASASSISILQAVVASRASTAGSGPLDSLGAEAHVVLLTAERDAARQQLDLLTANTPLLEGRLEEYAQDNERLLQQLRRAKQELDTVLANQGDLLARLAHLEEHSTAHSTASGQRSPVGDLRSPTHSTRGGGYPHHAGSSDAASSAAAAAASAGSRIPRPPPSSVEQPPSSRSDNGGLTSPPHNGDAVAAATGRIGIPKPSPTPSVRRRISIDGAPPLLQHAGSSSEQQLQELSSSLAALKQQVSVEAAARAEAEARAEALQEEKAMTAALLQSLSYEQVALAEQLRVLEIAKDALEEERGQLLTRAAEASSQLGDAVAERDLMLRRVAELSARASGLEDERDRLLERRERDVGVAAAAGAAGAAAAVAVATTAQPVVPGGRASDVEALAQRVAELEAELGEVVEEREATLRRSAHLEEEIDAMGELLQQAADEREAALQQVERMMVERAAAEEVHGYQLVSLGEQLHAAQHGAAAATAAAAAAAAGATAGALARRQSAGSGAGHPGLGSPLLPSRGPLGPGGGRRSRSNRVSTSQGLDEHDAHPHHAGSASAALPKRLSVPSGVLVHSSYASFSSDVPLLPTRHFGDASGTYSYLDPMDPLEAGPSAAAPGAMHARGSSAAHDPGALRSEHQEEVGQLQAAVCSLMVSKALVSAQLHAEHDAQLSMMQAAHQSQLTQLQDAHGAEVAGLQAARAAAVPVAPQRADRSTRVTETGLPAYEQLEAELRLRIAELEAEVTELQERHQQLAAQHAEERAQLLSGHEAQFAVMQVNHDSAVADLQLALEARQQAEDDAAAAAAAMKVQAAAEQGRRDEVAVLRQQAADLQAQAAQHEALAADLVVQLEQRQAELEERSAQLAADLRAHDAAYGKSLATGLESPSKQQHAERDADLAQKLADLHAQTTQHEALAADLESQLVQRQAEYEERLAQLAAESQVQAAQHEALVASLDSQLMQQQAEYEERVAQLAAELQAQTAQYDALAGSLDEQHVQRQAEQEERVAHQVAAQQMQAALHEAVVAHYEGRLSQQQEQHEEDLAQLAAESQAQAAEHGALLADLESQLAARQAEYEGRLAEAAAGLQGQSAELGALVTSLEAQLVQQQAEHEKRLAELEAEAQAEAAQHAAMMADLESQLSQRQAEHEQHLVQLTADSRSRAIEHEARVAVLEPTLAQQQAEHEERLAQLAEDSRAAAAQHDAVVADLESQLAQLQAQHAERLANVAAESHSRAVEHEARAATFEPALAQQQADHEERLAQLAESSLAQATQHDALVADLESQLAQQQAEYDERVVQLVAEAQSQAAEHAVLVADFESQLVQRQAEHEERSVLLAASSRAAIAEHEAAVADLESQLMQRQAEHEERLAQLTASSHAAAAEHDAVVAHLESQLALQQAEHDERLEQLAANSRVQAGHHEAALAELQSQLTERQAELAGLQARLAASTAGAEQEALALRQLEAAAREHASLVAELQAQVEQLQSEKELAEQSLQSLASTKSWMTDEIRSLQADLKEASAKVASVEAELSAAKAAPATAVAVKTAAPHGSRSSAMPIEPAPPSAVPASAPPVSAVARPLVAAATASSGPAAAAAPATAAAATTTAPSLAEADLMLETVELRSRLKAAESQVGALADLLAEAAMSAALAEARLEGLELGGGALPGGEAAVPGPVAGGGTAGPLTAAQTDMMMETVVLHGELDEVRGKQRVLLQQVDALSDELSYAVLRASLAEAQVEQLRVGRAPGAVAAPWERLGGSDAGAAATPAPAAVRLLAAGVAPGRGKPAPSAATAPHNATGSAPNKGAGGGSAVGASTALAPPSQQCFPTSKPVAPPVDDAAPPEHLGTQAFSPLEQTRHLQSELQAVARTLGEMFNDGQGPGQDPGSRQTLSSLRPAVITALHITENVASTLQQQQATAATSARTAGAVHLGQPHPAAGGAARPSAGDSDRARAAYRDAREVFDMLRCDAEDLNARLWRWSSTVREQLASAERELSRIQSSKLPAPPASLDEILGRKDAILRRANAQLAEMQAVLEASHARLMRRNGQVAALQHMLVQLSEQVTAFEGVIVRCEVLSADLMTKTGSSLGHGVGAVV